MYYQESGSGEPMVLLHGLGSCAQDWHYQIAYFSKRYRVISIDCRGHGLTEKPDGKYTIPLFAQDISQLLTLLNIKNYHLVGFSMGGMIAFQLSVDQPENIKTLTIINSAPAIPYNTIAMKLTVWMRLAIINILGLPRLGNVIAKKLFPKSDQQHLKKQYLYSLMMMTKSAYIRSLRSFLGWSVMEKLHRLTMPVLVITGDKDYTPVQDKVDYSQKIQRAKLVIIPDSYHATPLDQPTLLNLEIKQFIVEHTR